MQYTPKEVWQSVRVITGGDTIHNASRTIMWMRLPNGKLVTTDAENASIFGPHFDRVFNNHIPIDWTVLESIKQRYMMEELDPRISWDEIKKSTTKLVNEKAPGINGVPPNVFKAINDKNLTWILLFFNQLWSVQADSNKWHLGQVVPIQKKATSVTLASGEGLP